MSSTKFLRIYKIFNFLPLENRGRQNVSFLENQLAQIWYQTSVFDLYFAF